MEHFHIRTNINGFKVDTVKLPTGYFETAIFRGDYWNTDLCIVDQCKSVKEVDDMHSFWCGVCEWKVFHEVPPYSIADMWGDYCEW